MPGRKTELQADRVLAGSLADKADGQTEKKKKKEERGNKYIWHSDSDIMPTPCVHAHACVCVCWEGDWVKVRGRWRVYVSLRIRVKRSHTSRGMPSSPLPSIISPIFPSHLPTSNMLHISPPTPPFPPTRPIRPASSFISHLSRLSVLPELCSYCVHITQKNLNVCECICYAFLLKPQLWAYSSCLLHGVFRFLFLHNSRVGHYQNVCIHCCSLV